MGRLRREEHVGRHHIRRNVARHCDIYSQLGNDIKLRGLGSSFLYPRNVAADLVRRLLYILRRFAGTTEIHIGAGEIAYRQFVRPSLARFQKSENTLEKYILIGTVLGPDRYQYLGQFLLVLPAHPDAALYEQDTAI